MTDDQKTLVRTTFAAIAPGADDVAARFYDRLFTLDPSLRALFPNDMRAQGRKLMDTLATAVHGLDRLDELVPVLHELGRRHVGYGVKDEHYDTVAEALLWTLEQGLREQFTPEVKAAWVEVYTALATTMREGATRA